MTFPTPPNAWTDERVELLRDLWNRGYSASQVAKRLGEVTRNAVIGKVHRLKLDSRSPALVAAALAIGGRSPVGRPASTRPAKKPPRPKLASTTPRRPYKEASLPKATPVDLSHAKPWLERSFGQCAAPVGGEGADTLSCCTPSGDFAYCRSHRAVYFVRPVVSVKSLQSWASRYAA